MLEINTYKDNKRLTKQLNETTVTQEKRTNSGSVQRQEVYAKEKINYKTQEQTSYDDPERQYKDTTKKQSTPSNVYQIKYKGKTYNTENPNFKPKEYLEDIKEQRLMRQFPNTYYLSEGIKRKFNIKEDKGNIIFSEKDRKVYYNPSTRDYASLPSSAELRSYNIRKSPEIVFEQEKLPNTLPAGNLQFTETPSDYYTHQHLSKILGERKAYELQSFADKSKQTFLDSNIGQAYNKYIDEMILERLRKPFVKGQEYLDKKNIPYISPIASGVLSGAQIGLVEYPMFLGPYGQTKFALETLGTGGYNLAEMSGGIRKGLEENPLKTISELGTVLYLMPRGYKELKTKYGALEGQVPREFVKEYKDYTKALNKLRGMERPPAEVLWNRVESLENYPKAQTAIKKLLQENPDAILGGSTAIEAWGTKLTRKPQDIEIYIKSLDRIKEIRNSYKELITKNGLIEGKDFKMVNGNFHFAKDGSFAEGLTLHSYNQLKGNIQSVKSPLVPNKIYIRKTSDGISIVDPVILALRSKEGAFKEAGKRSLKQVEARLVEEGKSPQVAKQLANLETFYGKLGRYSKDTPRLVAQIEQLALKELESAKSYPPFAKQVQQYRAGQAIEQISPYSNFANVQRVNPKPYYYPPKVSRLKGLKYIDFKLNKLGKKGYYYNQAYARNAIAKYMIKQVAEHPYKYTIPYKTPNIPYYPTPYKNDYSLYQQTYPSKYEKPYVPQYTPKYQPQYTPKYQTPYFEKYSDPYSKVYTDKYDPYDSKYNIIGIPPTKPVYGTTYTKETSKETKIPKGTEKSEKVKGYTPLYISKNNKLKARGHNYASYNDAKMAGKYAVDNTAYIAFNIIKHMVNKRSLKKAPNYKDIGKFKRYKDTYLEKRYHRFDKKPERMGSFNIFPYVFTK